MEHERMRRLARLGISMLAATLLLTGCVPNAVADAGTSDAPKSPSPTSSHRPSARPDEATSGPTTSGDSPAPDPAAAPTDSIVGPPEDATPTEVDPTSITSNGYNKEAAWNACVEAAKVQYAGTFTSYSDFDPNSVKSATEVDPGNYGVIVTIPWSGEYNGQSFSSVWECLARGDQGSPIVLSVDVPEAKP